MACQRARFAARRAKIMKVMAARAEATARVGSLCSGAYLPIVSTAVRYRFGG